jgi:hypothetical protein
MYLLTHKIQQNVLHAGTEDPKNEVLVNLPEIGG